MRTLVISLALLAGSTGSAFAQDTLQVRLRCEGEVSKLMNQSTNVEVRAAHGSASRSKTTTAALAKTTATLVIQIDGSTGRMRMPATMVPALSTGAKDGWWPISDLQVKENQIKAKVALSPVNKPAIQIDRVAGNVEFKTSGGAFTGRCAPEEADKRLF